MSSKFLPGEEITSTISLVEIQEWKKAVGAAGKFLEGAFDLAGAVESVKVRY